jgi:probable phosphoglycerate mutase
MAPAPCPNGILEGVPDVWVLRHCETEWSLDGKHTSRTEVDLTAAGVAEARALRPAVDRLGIELTLCSPRRRARRTAELAGLVPFEVTEDLREWDYGEFEGQTTPEIRMQYPEWTIWDGPWPGGETAAEVAARADRLIERVRGERAKRVALVGHGHFSRVVAARWVTEKVDVGRWLNLDTGAVSQLGWYREDPVLKHWNVPVSPDDH